MIPKLLISLLIISYGVLFPVYWSHKALQSQQPQQVQAWLTHWIVFTIFTKILELTDFFFGPWLPFYNEIVFCVFLWFVCPAFDGISYTYNTYVQPFLNKHEEDIDATLKTAGRKAVNFILSVGSSSLKFIIDDVVRFIKENNSTDVNHKSYVRKLLNLPDNGGCRIKELDYVDEEEVENSLDNSAEDIEQTSPWITTSDSCDIEESPNYKRKPAKSKRKCKKYMTSSKMSKQQIFN